MHGGGGATRQKPCNYLSPALLILSLSFLYGEGLLVASHHRSTSSRTAGVTCLHRLQWSGQVGCETPKQQLTSCESSSSLGTTAA
jgi:hypothetical protein